ncbi:MAG: ribosomal protein L7/L12 [Sphingomonadales bacterium]|nr:ribosomal protein L7/L12 [Sphingomonadales bacterium]
MSCRFAGVHSIGEANFARGYGTVITLTLGWGAIAALLGWSAFVFWLGRMSGGASRDLSGPPKALATPRRAPPVGGDPAGLSPEQLAAIRAALTRGNKIEAIKLMRQATGLGLAEAKHAVEAMVS